MNRCNLCQTDISFLNKNATLCFECRKRYRKDRDRAMAQLEKLQPEALIVIEECFHFPETKYPMIYEDDSEQIYNICFECWLSRIMS